MIILEDVMGTTKKGVALVVHRLNRQIQHSTKFVPLKFMEDKIDVKSFQGLRVFCLHINFSVHLYFMVISSIFPFNHRNLRNWGWGWGGVAAGKGLGEGGNDGGCYCYYPTNY